MLEIGPQSNNSYTVKSLNNMKNALNTLYRYIYITWFTQMMGYIYTEIASPFITFQKDEGIQPATIPPHFLFTLSQSLSHNHRDCLQFYNAIHSPVTMLSFIREKIPWENTMVNLIPWVRIIVGQHTSQKKFSGAPPPNPRFSGVLPLNPIF